MRGFHRPFDWRPDDHESGVSWNEYTDADIQKAWETNGQGHHSAMVRGEWCVVVPCDQETATLLSRLFIREFAVPTCCHYDGDTLSMYCGDASGGARELMKRLQSIRPAQRRGDEHGKV